MKPLFMWAGGKNKMLKKYAKYLPTSVEHYVEPFLGVVDPHRLSQFLELVFGHFLDRLPLHVDEVLDPLVEILRGLDVGLNQAGEIGDVFVVPSVHENDVAQLFLGSKLCEGPVTEVFIQDGDHQLGPEV